ncbi:MAG TPA: hypothetical protein P5232_02790 [Candidatus Moranbacteria bacterium]|nr:hypothetical protein [Candidatus Moranbacteria bacterium]
MQKKQKNAILVGLIVLAIVVVFAVTTSILGKKSSQSSLEKTENPIATNELGVDTNPVKQITGGTVKDLSRETIKILDPQGKEISINIPSKNGMEVSLYKETEKAEGGSTMEDIGLFDIPLEKEVDVTYNSQSNDLIMLTVIIRK